MSENTTEAASLPFSLDFLSKKDIYSGKIYNLNKNFQNNTYIMISVSAVGDKREPWWRLTEGRERVGFSIRRETRNEVKMFIEKEKRGTGLIKKI